MLEDKKSNPLDLITVEAMVINKIMKKYMLDNVILKKK